MQVILDTNHFFQLNDVWMLQSSESADLSQLHALVPRFEFFLHLLDRYCFSGRLVVCFDHCAISPVTTVLYYLEFVHDETYLLNLN